MVHNQVEYLQYLGHICRIVGQLYPFYMDIDQLMDHINHLLNQFDHNYKLWRKKGFYMLKKWYTINIKGNTIT